MVEVTTRHSALSVKTTLNAEMKLGTSSLPVDRASSCSSTEDALQPQVLGQSLQKSPARSSSAYLEMYCQLNFHFNGCHGGARLGFRDCVPGFPWVSLCVSGQLLQQRVGLALGCLDAVGPHDASGPVEVEHHHQLLPLQSELLDLGLQVRVHHFQTLRFPLKEVSPFLLFVSASRCCYFVFLSSSFPPVLIFVHLCLDGQRPLPQPPQEVQRGQHGAQLAEVSQLELIRERGGRDARQRAQARQGARRHRRVRYLSRHHVRPGHHRRQRKPVSRLLSMMQLGLDAVWRPKRSAGVVGRCGSRM